MDDTTKQTLTDPVCAMAVTPDSGMALEPRTVAMSLSSVSVIANALRLRRAVL